VGPSSSRLPNDFILTLDTHFVASMILMAHYGTAPIRVVRKSQPHERGHQKFFDRLGYLYVYSGDVAPNRASSGPRPPNVSACSSRRRPGTCRPGATS